MARMGGVVGVSGVGGMVEMVNGVVEMDGIRKYGIFGLFLTYILTLSKIRLSWNRLEWMKIEWIY